MQFADFLVRLVYANDQLVIEIVGNRYIDEVERTLESQRRIREINVIGVQHGGWRAVQHCHLQQYVR